MGTCSHRLSPVATDIPLRWWQMTARSKTHDPFRRFAWSAANRAANNVFEMAALIGAIESVSRFDGASEIAA